MIIKNFELKNLIHKYNYFLLHGMNLGLIEDAIKENFINNISNNIFIYEEKDILINPNKFSDGILNKSFFDENKLIIINRGSDKILEIVKEIIIQDPEDIKIIINGEVLEKKSKLRNFFEKHKNTISTAFYEDNHQSLLDYSQNFLKNEKIKISFEALNMIVERSNRNRIYLNQELRKLVSFSISQNKISNHQINKLINVIENYSFSEIVNNYLSKNKKKTIKMLNESNLNEEDSLKITRILLQKLKRLKILKKELGNDKNIEQALACFKPTIFWKEKETVKYHLKNLSLKNINFLISEVNFLELKIKKNIRISKQLMSNFILERFQLFNNLV
jgi:DNA polymerase-3 subunit delta